MKDVEAMMGRKQENLDAKERAKVFSTMLCRGEISAAVRYISEREKGRVLLPGDIDKKSGDDVSSYGLNIQREEMWNQTKFRFLMIVKTCWTSRFRKHI